MDYLSSLRGLVTRVKRMSFENKKFWNERYSTDIGKGSGPGSRGEHAQLKAKIILDEIDRSAVKSVLDIGCGDIAILEGVEIEHYVGLDISDVVVERNKKLRPGWKFICADVAADFIPEPADLVLCLDVLIHQKHRSNYEMLIKRAIGAARKVALISGYSEQPEGWNVWFHEPLETSLRKLADGAELTKLANYRAVELWEVRRRG